MQTRRTFIIGEEWIYYKIYCGPKTIDKLLIGLSSIFDTREFKQTIDKWFFLRFKDPDNHLRIRFHFRDNIDIQYVAKLMEGFLSPFVKNDLVWDVNIATYQREIERYGSNTIERSEALFHHDSETTLKLIKVLDEVENAEELRWMFCLISIDHLFNDFQTPIDQRIEVLSNFKNSLFKEFQVEKPTIKKLAAKYRSYRKKINQFFDNVNGNEKVVNDYFPLFELLNNRSDLNREICPTFERNEFLVRNLLPSYIHMLCNRLFRSKQRANEMVIYDFLIQKYKTQLAIEKLKNKRPV